MTSALTLSTLHVTLIAVKNDTTDRAQFRWMARRSDNGYPVCSRPTRREALAYGHALLNAIAIVGLLANADVRAAILDR